MKKEQIKKTVAKQFERYNGVWTFCNDYYICKMFFRVQHVMIALSLTNRNNRIVLNDIRLKLFRKDPVSCPHDCAEFCGEDMIGQMIDFITNYFFRLGEKFPDVFCSVDKLDKERMQSAIAQMTDYFDVSPLPLL